MKMLSILAVLAMCYQTAALAAPGMPSGVTKTPVRVEGVDNSNRLTIIQGATTFNAQFDSCQIDWDKERNFYLISGRGWTSLISQRVFNEAWYKFDHDWEDAVNYLFSIRQNCNVYNIQKQ